VTALARLLWREKKKGLAAVAWLLTKFMTLHPDAALGAKAHDPNAFYAAFREWVEVSDDGKARLRHAAEKTYAKPHSDAEAARLIDREEAFAEFLMDLLRAGGPEELARLEPPGPSTLSGHGGDGTLAVTRAGRLDEKALLANVAEKRFRAEPDCEVIVMGHTHQPDARTFDGGRKYYNPGSWTRYIDISKQDGLTLDMLRDESKFPYQLNYIRIEREGGGRLASEKTNFEEFPGYQL
jgi:hypothetical protein